MPDSSEDRRPPIAVAMERASQITSVSLEMALPALGGWWADGKLNTSPWLVIIGAVLGLALGMYHLFQMVAREDRENQKKPRT